MVGMWSGSMRSTEPKASRRKNRSSIEVALAKASIWSAWPPIDSLKNSGPGCVVRRFTSHESRGITHWMLSGWAPALMSQTPASIAVLPAPTITKRRGRPPSRWPCHSAGRALGGTSRTPASTSKRGVWVDGTLGLKWVASTSFLRTCTCVRSPDRIDSNWPSPTWLHIGW